jgi:molybdopterin-guanine dinucleotide biosynthesis protein B
MLSQCSHRRRFAAKGVSAIERDAEQAMKVVGLAGWSGAGKTTLLTKLIPLLRSRGMSVSTIKHAHHKFDIDVPGKDSWRHREAGANEVLISSAYRFALMHEMRDEPELTLADLIARLSPVDLVIVEGFKRSTYPKIEVHRADNQKPLLFPDDPDIAGIAAIGEITTTLPRAHLDDIPAVADMVCDAAIPVAQLNSL